MREIIFRGKRVDNGEWIEGFLFNYNGVLCIQTEGIVCDAYGLYPRCYAEIIPASISEFTGLTDENGKKIFEGDICRFREWSKGDMCWIGKVHYEHQQFVISGNPNKECESEFLLVMSRFIPENIEIIGNIHDNPELLKGESNEAD